MTMGKSLENQICSSTVSTPSPILSMHKNSHTIAKKSKPKIRIIHIFAPEIIKTDAENFRELVQRLTGKPTDGGDRIKKKEQKLIHGEFRERIKGEEEKIWRVADSGGGFLGGFGDQFEYGFMQEIDQFPLLEGTNQMEGHFNLLHKPHF